MFIRTIIITCFNGFEKVNQNQKRKLARALNTMDGDINPTVGANIDSIDCKYRSEIYNTDSESSMNRRAALFEKLKAAKTDGISIEVFEIDEAKFAALPDMQKYCRASIAAEKSFEL